MKTLHSLSISDDVLADHPTYRAAIIYASGVENRPSNDESVAALRSAEHAVRQKFGEMKASEHPHIRSWREAYAKMGAKPSRFLCGAEALLGRVLNNHEIPPINRIVDLYNALSIRHVIPVGGEDREQLTGPLVLRYARGDEPFITGNADNDHVDHPEPGEIVWADPAGVTCRRWNWRQCSRTMITERSCEMYFVFDVLAPFGESELLQATEEFTSDLTRIGHATQIEIEEVGAALSRRRGASSTTDRVRQL